MASAPLPALRGQRIHDCSIKLDDDDINTSAPQSSRELSAFPLPVTLRIFFDPTKRTAFFRLYTNVELSIDTQTRSTTFYLDIFPDKVHTLSLHGQDAPGPIRTGPQLATRCLNFHLRAPGSIRLVAPQTVPLGPLHPATPAAQAIFCSLRHITTQSTICVLLPPIADDLPLDTCCHAISTQDLFVTPLRPDPGLVNLRTLYGGEGGRTVDIDRELALPSAGPGSSSPSAFPPPAYGAPASLAPVPSLLPTTAPETPQGKKRRQSRSPPIPCSDSSSPDYRLWAHLNLAVGEREKMMAELLRRADKKENALNQLLTEVAESARHLRELVAVAKESEAALGDRVPEAERQKGGTVSHQAAGLQSLVNAATPTAPSPQRSPSSTVSVASNISDRVQAYVNARLEELGEEIRNRGYVTADDVDSVLYEGGYVNEDAMAEAIEEAVDSAMDKVRDRILDAFS
ncbi:hypothetical protein INS49_012120 [Diaporthe citri]|uniref:uncharacterized protein n=1 Tax=Diaporthe citri TaxID=83186 RepID=UPI001C82577F|nr:uncharacterized protein INS49_012120 [Diaporthe citri]KAG6358602.1 hypothetical protein INS49_012120 [Diaporthe citri]